MTLSLDHVTPEKTWLSAWDARWKLIAFSILILCISFFSTLNACTSAGCLALLLYWQCEMPRSWAWRRISVPLGFVVPVALFLALFSPGGIRHGLVFLIRASAILLTVLTLLASTGVPQLLDAARRLHVPGVVIQMTAMTYRYLFVVGEEFARMRIAIRVRGYQNRVTRHSYRTIGHIVGTMLLRGFEQSERVTQAMKCRGFDGTYRIPRTPVFSMHDVLKTGIAVGAACVLIAIEWGSRP